MKTLDAIKDDVCLQRGYESYNNLVSIAVDNDQHWPLLLTLFNEAVTIYIDQFKDNNVVALILHLNTLTTTEFCDMYKVDKPVMTKDLSLTVYELLRIDAVKYTMIERLAKQIRDLKPEKKLVDIQVEKLIEFTSFQQWVNKASSWSKQFKYEQTIWLDTNNFACHIGEDFAYARDHNLFPITVYRVTRSAHQNG